MQAALDEIDTELNDHFTGAARRHPAGDIDYTPHGFVAAANVQAAIDELVDDLSTSAAGNPGAKRVGADAAAGAPHALPAGNVDGQHASAFATAGHDHDNRYLRRVYSTQVLMDPGTSQIITTQAEQPDLVSVSYNYPDAGTGLPQATTYIRGALTNDIRYWVTKIDMGGGDKDYRITVHNQSASQLWINVAVHRRD